MYRAWFRRVALWSLNGMCGDARLLRSAAADPPAEPEAPADIHLVGHDHTDGLTSVFIVEAVERAELPQTFGITREMRAARRAGVAWARGAEATKRLQPAVDGKIAGEPANWSRL